MKEAPVHPDAMTTPTFHLKDTAVMNNLKRSSDTDQMYGAPSGTFVCRATMPAPVLHEGA